eukprot:gnl/MRDRNA2_/MRDRNA2_103258_c0_seq1.p1 gnl/MRDRNA2_/MRDRNA2_103258_c0~~gnl/MRDRNA2_/MRDRNA2_103258_c0_seq1.p1  ORF type:complete len:108 (-),score=21.19 gnl/MRDRNA2_/MRDRNA2_103258_c0_seq1:38-361(-)
MPSWPLRALCAAAAAGVVSGQSELPSLPTIDPPTPPTTAPGVEEDAEANLWHSLAVSEDKQVSHIKDAKKEETELESASMATKDELWGFLMSRKHAWAEGKSTNSTH